MFSLSTQFSLTRNEKVLAARETTKPAWDLFGITKHFPQYHGLSHELRHRRSAKGKDKYHVVGEVFDDSPALHINSGNADIVSSDLLIVSHQNQIHLKRKSSVLKIVTIDPDNNDVAAQNADSPSQLEQLEHFQREQRLTAKYAEYKSKPVCLQLQSDGRIEAYFTMERIDGDSLHNILSRHKKGANRSKLTLLQRIQFAVDIASALKKLHDDNLRHTDVKPKNFMYCDKAGKVLLIDFGSTAPSGSRLQQSFSTDYAAPEGAAPGTPITCAWDIWSAGGVFHELFGVISPFVYRKRATVNLKSIFKEPYGHEGLLEDLDIEVDNSLFEKIYVLLQDMNAASPDERIDINEVLNRLHAIRLEAKRHYQNDAASCGFHL